jgi:iron complex outermembrane recepter protein
MGALVMTRGKTVKSWAMMTAACMALGAPLAGAILPVTSAKADAPAAAPASQVRYFRIAAQDLVAALNEFGRQSGRDILFSTEVAGKKRSAGVDGAMTAEDALRKLLAGTGLTFRASSGHTFLVEATAAPQAPAPDQRADAADQPTDDNEKAEEDRKVERVIVTGTHIRSRGAKTAPVTTITSKQLESTGQPTLARSLASLGPNFGGQSDQAVADPQSFNPNRGAGVNLRGLGFDATLILLNGRRPAKSGADGVFADISSIPSSAVERVEILTDGASAIYGSDALAGVVNIILKRNFRGLEASALGGISTEGGYDEHRISLTGGTAWDKGSVIFSLEHFEQKELTRSERDFSMDDNFLSIGGSDFRGTNCSPGTVTAVDGNLNALSAIVGSTVSRATVPAGQDGRSLTVASFVPTAGLTNTCNLTGPASLIPSQKRNSLFVSGQAELLPEITFSADIIYSTKENTTGLGYLSGTHTVPATNPFNPFGEAVNVAFAWTELGGQTQSSTTDALNAGGGFQGTRGDWIWQIDASYGRESVNQAITPDLIQGNISTSLTSNTNPATALNLFGAGTGNNVSSLASINTISPRYGITEATSLDVLATGPLFQLGDNDVDVAFGAQRRTEDVDNTNINATSSPAAIIRRGGSREIYAAFSELRIPILDMDPADGFINLFELSLAGRYENYSDFGSKFSPRLGAVLELDGEMTVRGSWGQSFKAPQLRELYDPQRTLVLQFTDPKRANQRYAVNFNLGGNPDLQAEEGDSWALGMKWSPHWASGLSLSANHFSFELSNRVARLNAVQVISQEDAFPGVVVRAAPTPADIAAGFAGQILAMNLRPVNFAQLDTEGLDLSIDYNTDVDDDWTFASQLLATIVTQYETRLTPTLPTVDALATLGNPPKVRLRGSASVGYQDASAMLTVTHSGEYRQAPTLTARTIDSYTTVDLSLTYLLSGDADEGIDLSLFVRDIFDEEPPFVNISGGFDPFVADPRGRMISAKITSRW